MEPPLYGLRVPVGLADGLRAFHSAVMTFRVRVLTPANLSVLSNVADDVFDDPIIEASAKKFLGDPNHALVVAMDESKEDLVIGFASGVTVLHPDKEMPELFINEVGVAPAYQRKGAGAAIMKTLFADAKRRGCRLGWVPVDADNETALAFYKAAGGKPPEQQVHIDFDL